MTRQREDSADDSLDESDRKRRKLDDVKEDPAGVPASQKFEPRHERMWFHDGSVVIAAKQMSFKVHASIISEQSEVLRNLFLDAEIQDLERFDGCYVFYLEDYGRDLARLLLIVYNVESREFFDRKIRIPFWTLRNTMLLAAKYGIRNVVREGILRLTELFPITFDDPESVYAGLHKFFPASNVHRVSRIPASSPLPSVEGSPLTDCIATAHLARVINCSTLRVIALYHCCQLDPSMLFEEVTHGESSVRLDLEDIKACVCAMPKLLHETSYMLTAIAFTLNHRETQGCMTRDLCATALRDMQLEYHIRCGYRLLDMLNPYTFWLLSEPLLSPLCSVCKRCLVDDVNRRRGKVFDRLNNTFEVSAEHWPVYRDPDDTEGWLDNSDSDTDYMS